MRIHTYSDNNTPLFTGRKSGHYVLIDGNGEHVRLDKQGIWLLRKVNPHELRGNERSLVTRETFIRGQPVVSLVIDARSHGLQLFWRGCVSSGGCGRSGRGCLSE